MFARQLGLDARVIPSKGKQREEHDAAVVAVLQEKQVDLVCLAGYMRLLSPLFIRAFPNRILNIHPALLPAFPGLEGQKQALEHGVKISGCTVHFVTAELDHGPIVIQAAVPVRPEDDVQSAMRLIQEHGVNQLPVVTEGRTVAGLLTRAGIMRLIETRLRLGV